MKPGPRRRPPAAARREAATRSPADAIYLGLWLAALVWGLWAAGRLSWTCDDAFISFRYADHLVRGAGLVFNPGERVEGFTNLLWTLWTALGMRLGADPEQWSVVWGLAFYSGCIVLLALLGRRLRRRLGPAALPVPLAALMAAALPDWNRFATSGLETSMFTFFVLLGFTWLTGGGGPRRAAAAALALALATLTRPDGLIFAGIGGLFLLWRGAPRTRSVAAFALVLAAICVPVQAWRWWYYGDFFPNTYYAKSAYLAWYSQGWTYLRLFLTQYWILGVGVLLGAAAPWAARPGRGQPGGRSDGTGDEIALALAFSLAYTGYVVRVGGDFMFARMLVPVMPFCLILLERGLARLLPPGRRAWLAASAAALVAAAAMPSPIRGEQTVAGIVNEWVFYTPERAEEARRHGEILRAYFEGLPVCVAFLGGEARLVYYSRPRVAIECATGLTDRYVAHQPLLRRARVGHEKIAPLDYLIRRRRAHFVLGASDAKVLHVYGSVPIEEIRFGETAGLLLHWDPALMPRLRQRGALFGDFPAILDGYLAEMPGLPDSTVRLDYAGARLFYFDHVADPAREKPFLDRLHLPPSGRARPIAGG